MDVIVKNFMLWIVKENGMTVIAIGWSRGNKKAIATILPTKYWDKLRNTPKFDNYDIQGAHRILKREAGIAYIVLRKIHYNVMRFRNAVRLMSRGLSREI